MKAHEFCYWLQGCFELGNISNLSEQQVQVIKNHLNMVFLHDIDTKYPETKELTKLHSVKPAVAWPFPSSKEPTYRC